MGKPSRAKGTRGELEVAKIYQRHGFEVERAPNSGGLTIKGDLVDRSGVLADLHIEVKRQEKLRLQEWLAQASGDAGPNQTPIVHFRQSRRKGRVGEWHVALPLGAYLELLKEKRL